MPHFQIESLVRTILPAFFVLSLLSGFAVADPQTDIVENFQTSHIDENIPPATEFDEVLKRDLLKFFVELYPSATTVEAELLRKGRTQSGVAYPKYYIWARIIAGKTLLDEGAVRVAAVEKTRFEIMSYQSKIKILQNPSETSGVFPAALVPYYLANYLN